ncbi:hypothetical protein M433DRAFT_8741 [Acidomyces richmondensis BFW]|nr:MAG: hypothetical protein FE78DRAFT_172389 [Acidomyces sp. 'richmondensis']KYG40503.1 hypothetical protein M433DRAFT_8741 [Acidomyces richmondensis BFW]
MPRGNDTQAKCHYKGPQTGDDFIVFVESPKAVQDWKKDSSIPLVQVANSFDVFVTHRQGAQGILDRASKAQLESEFGTSREDDVVKAILEKGNVIESEFPGRQGDKNLADGPRVAH